MLARRARDARQEVRPARDYQELLSALSQTTYGAPYSGRFLQGVGVERDLLLHVIEDGSVAWTGGSRKETRMLSGFDLVLFTALFVVNTLYLLRRRTRLVTRRLGAGA